MSICNARRVSACLLAWVPLLAVGCVEHALMESVRPTEYPWPPEVAAPAPADGAIWRGQTNSGSFLYFDRKARGIGDLVTVVILENLQAAGSANTKLDRSSGISADVQSDLGFTDVLQAFSRQVLQILGVSSVGNAVPAGATVNALEANTESGFEGDGETNRRSTFSGVVTCRVVEVLDGEIFHIYGKRKILLNHELQLVTIDGFVRRKDIQIDNTVASTQLADVKLTFDGVGVIDDEQRPPLIARLIAWIYPF